MVCSLRRRKIVHTYSLIHDDLPAMDDDAMRRGRLTVHKAFDQATAILAGDALLTFAFDLLARPETHPDAEVRIALVSELSRAAGLGGMAGGQILDLAAEGRFGATHPRPSSEEEVATLEAMKTGALLRAGCRMGAILGRAAAPARDALDRYGYALGQAFQIADDLLDLEGDAATVGKATHKDAAAGKATLVGILGAAGARARLAALVHDAEAALSVFGEDAAMLRAAAHFVADRRA
jgi:farnesyl diphosphate synthase